ncbi:MAG: serine hydrolase domain-containing protein [Geminicoccaceae bacterium]
MRRSKWLWLIAFVIAVACVFVYLILTGERGLSGRSMQPRPVDVTRLGAETTERLGWKPSGLDAIFDHAASLSTDTLMIITDGEIVGMFGDIDKRYHTHSIRKAFLSSLIGQHVGPGEKQMRLDETLEELGIDDSPIPLTPLQKTATVLDLLKSISGINHPAAAEEGLLAEKHRRLGDGENSPGTIWAYNNWDYNALTTIFEMRTEMSIAEAFGAGIAGPLGMLDHAPDAIDYIEAPELSQHRAASFHMSGRDLARFGELYLDNGVVNGEVVMPGSWIDRITSDFKETGNDDDLRHGHGYLWWVPGPDTGLPEGSFWAWGLGQQALIVIPAWQTVIVHQSDTTEFRRRFFGLIYDEGVEPERAFEQIAFSCRKRSNRTSEFCVEHRFILRPEMAELVALIVGARGQLQ